MKSIVRLTLLIAIALISSIASAQAPLSLPNPNVGNPDNFIYDPMGLLSQHTASTINRRLAEVRQKTTCEVAVAIVANLSDLEPQEYAYQLFKHWGIGKKDKNNGILLLVAPNERKAWIEVGSGAEGVLTDIACSNILRNDFKPAAQDGNISQGVAKAVGSISLALMDPNVAAELRSSQDNSTLAHIEALDSNVFFSFLYIIIACVFIFTLILFIADIVVSRRRDNYRRAMTWRNHMGTYWWGAFLSCGAALPIALIAYALYRHARYGTEVCTTCGGKMKRMSEEEDNDYLAPAQDFEEKIGTVDYDVWVCPDCGTVERFPYVEKQLKYQECPECHTIAMNLVMDKVVDAPTTRREGHGERLYQCQFCRHKKYETYRIPRKTDNSALAAGAAGAVLGAMASGRRGGFGGGSGGGFGGGSSSGGGAGTSW